MNSDSLVIRFLILFSLGLIYIVENSKDIKSKFEKSMPARDIVTIFIVVLFLVFVFQSGYYGFLSIKNLSIYKEYNENEKLYIDTDKKIFEENKYYSEKRKLGIDINKAKNPYLPDGFKHIDGNVENGFVIKDDDGNEFVWIPCTLDDNEYAKFEKQNFNNVILQNRDSCYDINYKRFMDSVFENGGFYVSRYEIANENGKFFSKPNTEVAFVKSRDEAANIVNSICNGKNVELINGFAYDAMLSWIMKEKEEQYFYNENEQILSGRHSVKNIYDVFDNVFEITNECSTGTAIKRGIAIEEQVIEDEGIHSRYPITEEFDENEKLAVRVVLYK